MNVESILRKHARPASLLATEPVKRALLADLRAHKRFSGRIYGVLFTLQCVLAFMAIAALFTDLIKGTNARELVLGAAGVGVPATVLGIQRLVREWSNSNLLITLVSHSDESAIQALIDKLISTHFEEPERPRKAHSARRVE